MQLSNMFIGPFVQGIIRVATESKADENGETRLKFRNEMEVVSRHHAKIDSEEADTQQPKLAPHPIADALCKVEANVKAGKLVEIPIKLFFNKPENAIQARYQAYNPEGRPVCFGDGKTATRVLAGVDNQQTCTNATCAGAEVCDFAASGQVNCRRQVTMDVQIDGQDDPLSVFQVRTSSYHGYKALRGQIHLISRQFGGLRHVPLVLKLWQASSQASNYESFDVVCLALNAKTIKDAMKAVQDARTQESEAQLCGDVDEEFVPLMTNAEPNRAFDDFDVVSDFYEPRQTARVTRRAGTSGAVTGASPESLATAANVLASAVKSGRAAHAQLTTETH